MCLPGHSLCRLLPASGIGKLRQRGHSCCCLIILQISTKIFCCTITVPVWLTLITLYILCGIVALWWPLLCFYVLCDYVFVIDVRLSHHNKRSLTYVLSVCRLSVPCLLLSRERKSA